jgi:hypothetical protein
MAKAIVPQERLLYASYSPPHLYDDGTDEGQPLVTALFREPTNGGGWDTPSANTRWPRDICSTAFPKAAATGAGR